MGPIESLSPRPMPRAEGGRRGREGAEPRSSGQRPGDRVVLSDEGRELALRESSEDLERRSAERDAARSRSERARLLAPEPPGVDQRLEAARLAQQSVEASERATINLGEDLRQARARAAEAYREIGRQDPRNRLA